jgi:hypothetical protein
MCGNSGPAISIVQLPHVAKNVNEMGDSMSEYGPDSPPPLDMPFWVIANPMTCAATQPGRTHALSSRGRERSDRRSDPQLLTGDGFADAHTTSSVTRSLSRAYAPHSTRKDTCPVVATRQRSDRRSDPQLLTGDGFAGVRTKSSVISKPVVWAEASPRLPRPPRVLAVESSRCNLPLGR